MTLSNILSAIAVLLAATVVVWMKILFGRAFKTFDETLKEIKDDIADLDTSVRKVEKDIIRLSGVEKDIKHVKADVVRETQVMNNQLESVHKKIDHLDEKFDKFRDSRGGRS